MRMITELLAWIQDKTEQMVAPLKSDDKELNGELKILKIFRTREKPVKYIEKTNIESHFFEIQSKLSAAKYKSYIPPNGFNIADINNAWSGLEKAEHAREQMIKEGLLRYEQIATLIQKFSKKVLIRITWIDEFNIALNNEVNIKDIASSDHEVYLKRYQGMEADIKTRSGKFDVLEGIILALKELKFHDTESLVKRKDVVVQKAKILLQKVTARKKSLLAAQSTALLLGEINDIASQFEDLKVLRSDQYGNNTMETDLHIESFHPKFTVLLNTQQNLKVLKQKIGNSAKSNTLQAAKLNEQVLELDRLGDALEAAAKHRLKVLEQTKIEHIHMTNIMDLNLLIEEKLSIVSIQNVGTNLSTCRKIDRKHQIMAGEMKIITSKVNELILHEPSISENKSQVVSAARDLKQKLEKLLHAIDIKTEYLRLAKIIFEYKEMTEEALNWIEEMKNAMEQDYSCRDINDVKKMLKDLSQCHQSVTLYKRDMEKMERKFKLITKELSKLKVGKTVAENVVLFNHGMLASKYAEVSERYEQLIITVDARNLWIGEEKDFFALKIKCDDIISWGNSSLNLLKSIDMENQVIWIIEKKLTLYDNEKSTYDRLKREFENAYEEKKNSRNSKKLQNLFVELINLFSALYELRESLGFQFQKIFGLQQFQKACEEITSWINSKLPLLISDVDTANVTKTKLALNKFYLIQKESYSIDTKIANLSNQLKRLGKVQKEETEEQTKIYKETRLSYENFMDKLKKAMDRLNIAYGSQGFLLEADEIINQSENLQSMFSETLIENSNQLDQLINTNTANKDSLEIYLSKLEQVRSMGTSLITNDPDNEMSEKVKATLVKLETISKSLNNDCNIYSQILEMRKCEDVYINKLDMIENKLRDCDTLIEYLESEKENRERFDVLLKQSTVVSIRMDVAIKSFCKLKSSFEESAIILNPVLLRFSQVNSLIEHLNGKLRSLKADFKELESYQIFVINIENLVFSIKEKETFLNRSLDSLSDISNSKSLKPNSLYSTSVSFKRIQKEIKVLSKSKAPLLQQGNEFIENCCFKSSEIYVLLENAESMWNALIAKSKDAESLMKDIEKENNLKKEISVLQCWTENANKYLPQVMTEFPNLHDGKKIQSKNSKIISQAKENVFLIEKIVNMLEEFNHDRDKKFFEHVEKLKDEVLEIQSQLEEKRTEISINLMIQNLNQEVYIEQNWINEALNILNITKEPGDFQTVITNNKSLQVQKMEFSKHNLRHQKVMEFGRSCLENVETGFYKGKINCNDLVNVMEQQLESLEEQWSKLGNELNKKATFCQDQVGIYEHKNRLFEFIEWIENKMKIFHSINQSGMDLATSERLLKNHKILARSVSQYKKNIKNFLSQLNEIEKINYKEDINKLKISFKKLEGLCKHREKQLNENLLLFNLYSDAEELKIELIKLNRQINSDNYGSNYEEVVWLIERFISVKENGISLEKLFQSFKSSCQKNIQNKHSQHVSIENMERKMQSMWEKIQNKLKQRDKRLQKAKDFYLLNHNITEYTAKYQSHQKLLISYKKYLQRDNLVNSLKEEFWKFQTNIRDIKHYDRTINNLEVMYRDMLKSNQGKSSEKLGICLQNLKNLCKQNTSVYTELNRTFARKISKHTFTKDVRATQQTFSRLRGELAEISKTSSEDLTSVLVAKESCDSISEQLGVKQNIIERLKLYVSQEKDEKSEASLVKSKTVTDLESQAEDLKQQLDSVLKSLDSYEMHFKFFDVVRKCNESMGNFQEKIQGFKNVVSTAQNGTCGSRNRLAIEYGNLVKIMQNTISSGKDLIKDFNFKEKEVQETLQKLSDELEKLRKLYDRFSVTIRRDELLEYVSRLVVETLKAVKKECETLRMIDTENSPEHALQAISKSKNKINELKFQYEECDFLTKSFVGEYQIEEKLTENMVALRENLEELELKMVEKENGLKEANYLKSFWKSVNNFNTELDEMFHFLRGIDESVNLPTETSTQFETLNCQKIKLKVLKAKIDGFGVEASQLSTNSDVNNNSMQPSNIKKLQDKVQELEILTDRKLTSLQWLQSHLTLMQDVSEIKETLYIKKDWFKNDYAHFGELKNMNALAKSQKELDGDLKMLEFRLKILNEKMKDGKIAEGSDVNTQELLNMFESLAKKAKQRNEKIALGSRLLNFSTTMSEFGDSMDKLDKEVDIIALTSSSQSLVKLNNLKEELQFQFTIIATSKEENSDVIKLSHNLVQENGCAAWLDEVNQKFENMQNRYHYSNNIINDKIEEMEESLLIKEVRDDCSELQEELSTVDFQKYEDILLEYDNILVVEGSLRELELLYAKADHFHAKLEHLKHSLSKTTLVSNREKSECEFILSDLSETVKSFDEITKKYKTLLEEHSKAVVILHSVKKRIACVEEFIKHFQSVDTSLVYDKELENHLTSLNTQIIADEKEIKMLILKQGEVVDEKGKLVIKEKVSNLAECHGYLLHLSNQVIENLKFVVVNAFVRENSKSLEDKIQDLENALNEITFTRCKLNTTKITEGFVELESSIADVQFSVDSLSRYLDKKNVLASLKQGIQNVFKSYNTVIDLYNKHQHTLKKMNTYHNLAEEIAQAKEFFSLQTNVIEKFQVKETSQVADIVIIVTQLKWISQETKYHSQQHDKVKEKYGELFEEKECDSYQFANEDFLELALVREAFHKFIAEKVSYFNETLEILKVMEMLEKSLWKKLEELNKEIEDFEETDTKKQSQIQSKFHQQLETLNCVFHEIIGKEVELFKSETHHVLLNRYKVLKAKCQQSLYRANHNLHELSDELRKSQMYDDFKNQYRLLDKWLQNQIDFVNISDDDVDTVDTEEDTVDLNDENVKRCEDIAKNGLLNTDFFHGNAIIDFENLSIDIAKNKDYRYFNSIESSNRLSNKISKKGKEIEEFIKLADKIGEEDPQAKPQISRCVINICELHNDVKELVSTRVDQLSTNYEGFKRKRKIKYLVNTVDVCVKVLSGIKFENDQEKLEEADEVLNAVKLKSQGMHYYFNIVKGGKDKGDLLKTFETSLAKLTDNIKAVEMRLNEAKICLKYQAECNEFILWIKEMTQNLNKISGQILSSVVSPKYAQKLHMACVKQIDSRAKQFEKLRDFPRSFLIDYSMFQDKTKSIWDSLNQTWEGLSEHLRSLKAQVDEYCSVLNFSNEVGQLEDFLSMQEKLLEYPIVENLDNIEKLLENLPKEDEFRFKKVAQSATVQNVGKVFNLKFGDHFSSSDKNKNHCRKNDKKMNQNNINVSPDLPVGMVSYKHNDLMKNKEGNLTDAISSVVPNVDDNKEQIMETKDVRDKKVKQKKKNVSFNEYYEFSVGDGYREQLFPLNDVVRKLTNVEDARHWNHPQHRRHYSDSDHEQHYSDTDDETDDSFIENEKYFENEDLFFEDDSQMTQTDEDFSLNENENDDFKFEYDDDTNDDFSFNNDTSDEDVDIDDNTFEEEGNVTQFRKETVCKSKKPNPDLKDLNGNENIPSDEKPKMDMDMKFAEGNLIGKSGNTNKAQDKIVEVHEVGQNATADVEIPDEEKNNQLSNVTLDGGKDSKVEEEEEESVSQDQESDIDFSIFLSDATNSCTNEIKNDRDDPAGMSPASFLLEMGNQDCNCSSDVSDGINEEDGTSNVDSLSLISITDDLFSDDDGDQEMFTLDDTSNEERMK